MEYLNLVQLIYRSDHNNVIPTFGKWMSNKYLWKDEEVEAEEDFNKAFKMISERYVQETD